MFNLANGIFWFGMGTFIAMAECRFQCVSLFVYRMLGYIRQCGF